MTGKFSNDAALLLSSGAAIFITNVIVFGIWYWENDLGGPFARAAVVDRDPKRTYPDVTFPRQTNPLWRRRIRSPASSIISASA